MLHVEKFVDKLTEQSYSTPKFSRPRITLYSQLVVEFFNRKYDSYELYEYEKNKGRVENQRLIFQHKIE